MDRILTVYLALNGEDTRKDNAHLIALEERPLSQKANEKSKIFYGPWGLGEGDCRRRSRENRVFHTCMFSVDTDHTDAKRPLVVVIFRLDRSLPLASSMPSCRLLKLSSGSLGALRLAASEFFWGEILSTLSLQPGRVQARFEKDSCEKRGKCR